MAENTKIQWTRHTFNPWIGCTAIAEGCKNCYAEFLMADRYHRVIWGPNGSRQRTKTWRDPVKWNRDAEAEGEARKVFCASLADVFEDFSGAQRDEKTYVGSHGMSNDALLPWRLDLFDLIDATPALHWLLLTKRPGNVIRMWPEKPWPNAHRENVWLGTSVANQKNANDNIDRLVECRDLCRFLFLSVEPQIGFIDLSQWLFPDPKIDWVIIGGESKQGKDEPRPFSMEWARFLLSQCREAGVPAFMKQFGSNVFDHGRRADFADSHGGDWMEWPEEFRVRECPESYLPDLV